MKRLLTTLLFVGVYVMYALIRRDSAIGVSPTNSATNNTTTISNPVDNNPGVSATSPVPAPPTPAGQYRNGSYTGSVEDAYYGNVQVRASVSNGQLTQVDFLQYPNDRQTSRLINSQAMPMLIQQALQAQSATVDGVSGATDTSMAFQASLANALNQAK